MLLSNFGDQIIAIQHIGSTAIPGMLEPIININVAVPSLERINSFIEKLPKIGYKYIPERRFSDRQFFPKGPDSKRTHHLNLVKISSETCWKNQLLFQDYMRTHADTQKAYIELKTRLVEKYADNRDEYTEQKSSFIREIIEKAKRPSQP